MIQSMTGFARERFQLPEGEWTWEIRAVNHRHLEVSLRLPEAVRDLEMAIREQVKNTLTRGKVDVSLSLASSGVAAEYTLSEAVVQQLLSVASQVQHQASNTLQGLSLKEVLTWPGVLNTAEPEIEPLQAALLKTLQTTLVRFQEVRGREGVKIAEMLLQRVVQIEAHAKQVLPLLADVQQQMRDRLLQRFADLQLTLDPARLEQEMVLLLQKMDVAEELDRLQAHCTELRHLLKEGGTVGRKLDFLMQEFNREANTLGSKSNATAITRISVELKVLIEQMREQIQNLE